MTVEEKASLCSGLNFWHLKEIERLGIPSIMVTDGPHGLRKQVGEGDQLGQSIPATCFPTASALAATWNRELVAQVGIALGEECRQEKVGVILGPGANIKRSPLCGRNFEYFSEDPYLTGEIAKSHISGVQSQGVGASLKHYAVNNQEYRRMTIDAVVDERALREIYLAGFEIAVKEAQPWTVMGAYNKLNGTYCCEHPALLREILKEEWGYEGVAVTDWGAMNERVDALVAGLDLEMPGSNNGNDAKIVVAIRDGTLDEVILDRAVERVLMLIFKAQEILSEDFTYDPMAHHVLARRVAGEGAVLLKNEANLLPFAKNVKVAVLGEFAKIPRYQGAGSSLIHPSYLDNLYDEMVKIAGEANLTFAPGYTRKGGQVGDDLIREAVVTAKGADVVVIMAGLPEPFEVEGLDRKHINLPESHNSLIEAVASVHDKVVVVLSNGAPVAMPWVSQVPVVLEGYLGGQAGAGAIADILYGVVNPSGKLAETFPLKLGDMPTCAYYPGGPKRVAYRESVYVGYRFFDTVGKDVLFPFGHGLSFTTFEYSDLHLSRKKITDQESLTVRFKVKNTGLVAGQEIVQLYVGQVEPTVFRPKAELKGFEKVSLLPGEEQEVVIILGYRAFAYFNTGIKDWHVVSGNYQILVGASSRDIRLRGEVEVESSRPDVDISARDQHPTYIHFPEDARISRQDFEALLGRTVPANEYVKGELYTINTPINDMQDSFVARLLHSFMQKQGRELIKDDPNGPNAQVMLAAIEEAPLRLLTMTGDIFNRGMVDSLLLMINKKFIRGLVGLLRAIMFKRQLKAAQDVS
ncbi:MAG: glycoside hydrolase family 3 C-terminal domain-containing protein [Anaerolineae bacterium]|nr:glycoside hydrolase family 3 C-terminal domain-containing protein [Anaerolineae bacterium]